MQIDIGLQKDAGSEPDMLAILRTATGPAHKRLDAAFGSLDLAAPTEVTRFLAAHAIALAPLAAGFRRFLEDELHVPCPDYPAMLQEDLAARGTGAANLPTLPPLPELSRPGADAGIAYVLCGSRLGMVVIRRQGYWGAERGFRSRYMDDDQGQAAWKALLSWLRTHALAPAERDGMRLAALAAFDAFARAFAMSPAMPPLMPACAGQRIDG